MVTWEEKQTYQIICIQKNKSHPYRMIDRARCLESRSSRLASSMLSISSLLINPLDFDALAIKFCRLLQALFKQAILRVACTTWIFQAPARTRAAGGSIPISLVRFGRLRRRWLAGHALVRARHAPSIISIFQRHSLFAGSGFRLGLGLSCFLGFQIPLLGGQFLFDRSTDIFRTDACDWRGPSFTENLTGAT